MPIRESWRWAAGHGLALLALACSTEEPIAGHGQDDTLQRIDAHVPDCEALGRSTPAISVDTIARGLAVPWDLAFLPDGRALVTEREGRIRVIDEEGLREEPWASLDVAAVAEAGLLGIDVAGDFPTTGHVYVVRTHENVRPSRLGRLWAALVRRIGIGRAAEQAAVWESQVVRLTDDGNRGTSAATILDHLPSGPIHVGGALRFGPESRLHVGIGDGASPPAAADPTSLRGKLLRIDSLGRAAAGNPWSASPVFALGFRNPQGLAWDPAEDRRLFAIDHGPTGLEREDRRRHRDELNVIVPGGNYGWPTAAGMWKGEGLEPPIVEWTPALAPAGVTFAEDPESAWYRDVLVTGLIGRQLRRVVLDPARSGSSSAPLCEEVLFEQEHGRLRAIRSAPDGSIWVGTSNRDQRGVPGPEDDLLLRVQPSGSDG